MTAAAASLPTASWTLASSPYWRDQETVILDFEDEHSGESALVTVRVAVELPSTASEPEYPPELIVRDIEGAPIDADAEVERLRDELVEQFWRGRR